MTTIRLTQLQCFDTQEISGPDQAVLFVFRDGNYAGGRLEQLRAGESWGVNWELEFQNSLQVYLVELDGPRTGDILGEVVIDNDNDGTQLFERVGARYELSWVGVGTAPGPGGGVVTPVLARRQNEATLTERDRFVAADVKRLGQIASAGYRHDLGRCGAIDFHITVESSGKGRCPKRPT